ncbi:MAG TPA: magnesium transporter [Sphingomonadaceae bacterium]|nr:magnesium transporter [Sphingomonadaceae bacterium]
MAEADIVVPAQLDEDDRLKPAFVREVQELVEAGDAEGARALVIPLHPADIADLFELIPAHDRAPLAAAIADVLDADVFAEMNDHVRDGLLDQLDAGQLADIAGDLDTDDAVAIIEDLEADEQAAVLREMEPDERAAIEQALTFPEESAGRLMQRDLVAVPEHWTVGQVIDYLRGDTSLTTDFWEVFVVDPQHKPVGTCMLSWIMRTPRGVAVADVMQREQTLIPVDMDQEEVALRFQKYALISAAVIDADGRLVGMITVDDVVHIIQEEASEDALLLSGAGEGDINEPIMDSYRARVRWLVANLGTALVASTIIGLFSGAISEMVALAVLMPIVAGVGGNAGTQTLAVTVRALATNQLTQSNTMRTIVREIRIALMNGATIAVVIGIGVSLVFASGTLGAVIAAAMMTNIVIAGLAGVLVPLAIERMDGDPAVASSVFVTMVTDSMGFLAFLGLAVATGLVGA